MKYFSEKTNKLYESEKLLFDAEKEYDKEQERIKKEKEEKLIREKKLKEEKESRIKEVELAFDNAINSYNKLLQDYKDDFSIELSMPSYKYYNRIPLNLKKIFYGML